MQTSVTFSGHLCATWALIGLIWLIQVVHYPLLAAVGEYQFGAYHAAHVRRITWVVGPLMLAELGSAALLFWEGKRDLPFALSLAMLGAVWLSTAVVQVPLHHKLKAQQDLRTLRSLVRSNWIRTAAWSLRGLLLLPFW